jgi:hypothetical protein
MWPASANLLISCERLEAKADYKAPHAFPDEIAVRVVERTAVTLLNPCRAARTHTLLVSAIIVAATLAILHGCRSKLITPLVLGPGVAIGLTSLI